MLPDVGNVAVTHAMQELLADGRGQVGPGSRQQGIGCQTVIGFEGLGDTLVDMFAPAAQAANGTEQHDGSLLQRFGLIGDQYRLIEIVPDAQPLAIDAHALWAVKTEELRAWRFVADFAMRAGIVRTVKCFGRCGCRYVVRFGLLATFGGGFRGGRCRPFLADNDAAARQADGVLDGFGQAGPAPSSGRKSIDDNLNVVPHLAVELEIFGEMDDLAVDSSAQKSLLQQVFEQIAVLPFLSRDNRGQHHETLTGGQTGQAFQDLIDRLGCDRAVTFGAESLAYAGEEDSQVIVDFGNGADSTARIPTARLLLDGDGGGEAGD